MSLVDAFFRFAVPLVVVTAVLAGVVVRYDRARGIYRSDEGVARRDEINRTYRTNAGAIVIGVAFVGVWAVMVAAMIGEWGAIPFTFVIALLLLIPVGTVAVCVIAIWTLAVHAFANARRR